jgi:2'-hydroxyisoflavone reductase
MVRMAEQRAVGAFNATTEPFRFEELVDGCRSAAGADAEVTWVDEQWLLEREVAPWMELPVWIPQGVGSDSMHRSDVHRAVEAGLTFRSQEQTARDTLAWLRTRPAEGAWQHTLTSEREAELLKAWHART